MSKEIDLKINLIEANDGIETIFLLYKAITKGISIACIFSDENMVFLNGLTSSEIIKDICKKKGIPCPPIYLVTAYDKEMIGSYIPQSIKKILAKPLKQEVAKECILENYLI